MTSSDFVALSAKAGIESLEDDKYVLVWGNSEIVENFYAGDVGEAKRKQEQYDKRTGLETKLYLRVKE